MTIGGQKVKFEVSRERREIYCLYLFTLLDFFLGRKVDYNADPVAVPK